MKCEGRVVLYVRVSTSEQHLGAEAQMSAANDWAKTQGLSVDQVFTDHGISGGKGLKGLELDLAQRPALLEAIDTLAQGDILLVAKRDRLARDAILAGLVERLVTRRGAEIVSADGAGNGAGPEAMLLRTIINAFAEYERLLIKARTKSALSVKKARGERTGQIPYGKRLAQDGVKLHDDLDEQKVILKIIQLRRTGMSLRGIATQLNESRVPARQRAGYSQPGEWRHPIVGRIVAQAM